VGRLLRATAETTDPRQGNDPHLVRQAISTGEMVPQVCHAYRAELEDCSPLFVMKSTLICSGNILQLLLTLNCFKLPRQTGRYEYFKLIITQLSE
jgi:hypothetical protein